MVLFKINQVLFGDNGISVAVAIYESFKTCEIALWEMLLHIVTHGL